jgi:hypothetical protein
VLADLGEIPLEKVTMQSIRAWFRINPDRVNEISGRTAPTFSSARRLSTTRRSARRRGKGAADARPFDCR